MGVNVTVSLKCVCLWLAGCRAEAGRHRATHSQETGHLGRAGVRAAANNFKTLICSSARFLTRGPCSPSLLCADHAGRPVGCLLGGLPPHHHGAAEGAAAGAVWRRGGVAAAAGRARRAARGALKFNLFIPNLAPHCALASPCCRASSGRPAGDDGRRSNPTWTKCWSTLTCNTALVSHAFGCPNQRARRVTASTWPSGSRQAAPTPIAHSTRPSRPQIASAAAIEPPRRASVKQLNRRSTTAWARKARKL